MSERTSRILPILALALLFGSVLLVVQPTTAFPVTPAQSATVQSNFGEGAPFQDWKALQQRTRFYLHSDDTATAAAPFVVGTPPNARMDVIRPTNALDPEPLAQADATADPAAGDHTAVIAAPGVSQASAVTQRARFVMDAATIPVDRVNLFQAGAIVYAACDTTAVNPLGAGGNTIGGITAVVTLQKTEDAGATWTDVSQIASFNLVPQGIIVGAETVPGIIQGFSGASSNIGNTVTEQAPALLAGVNRLTVEFRLPTQPPGVTCYLHYDSASYPSHLWVRDDSARMVAFAQDLEGNHVVGFPSADHTEFAERRITIQHVIASPWGNGALQLVNPADHNQKVRIFDPDATEYLYYVENLSGGEPNEIEFTEIDLLSTERKAISPTVARNTFVLQYPADLEDGFLEPQIYELGSHQWDFNAPTIRLGGRGMDIRLPNGTSATHTINPLQVTEFAYEVVNTGTEDDLVTVAASDPGSGWTARVLGGGLHFLRPGGTAIGFVELTPPATAVAGNSRTVSVSASSSHADVEDPAPLSFRAEVVDAVVRKVDLVSTATQFQIRPGETKGFPLTVINGGTSRDSFVIVPSFPANVQGWTVVSNPSSLQVVAGGLQHVQVLITAPPEVTTGTTFPLGLTALEVGDSAVSDRIDVPVHVFALEGVLVSLFEPDTNRTMRLIGPDCVNTSDPFCATSDPAYDDHDYDNSAIFRLPVTNTGDLPARFKVEAFWDASTPGAVSTSECDATVASSQVTGLLLGALNDGVPDGWRFNYEAGAGDILAVGSGVQPDDANSPRGARSYGGFSGFYALNGTDNPLVVPGRTTEPVYFELGWLDGDACPANGHSGTGLEDIPFDALSPRAGLRVRVINLDDATQVSDVLLVADTVDAGTFLGTGKYSAATHAVGIDVAPNQAAIEPVVPGQPVVFDVIAVNKGNEKDDLKITVTGANDWAHRLAVVESVPPGKTCEFPTDGGTTITCLGVGVFEEIHLQVIATPDGDVRIGERDPITVTVLSGDAPGIARTLGLVARAAGTLDFDMGALGNTTRGVPVGGTVSFPLFIDNQGTSDDSYRISILRGDVNAWKASLSTSAPLFVPAGHEVSAFLTVQAPASGLAGTTDVFRVQVESIGSGTKKTVEFSPVVQAASNLLVVGKDGQDVLIPQRNKDTWINVTAVQTSGTPVSSITFNVDTASLPHGWTVDKTTQSKAATLDSSGRPTATVPFKVKAPADALGTSRGLLHVDAVAGALRGGTDINLNLASTYGLDLNVSDANATKQVVAPGGSAIYNLTLSNLGLGQDTVRMTNTVLPSGWTLLFNPGSATLGPLEERDVEVKVSAPVTARPADLASVVVFANSLTDPTQLDSLALVAQVGFHEIGVELVSDVVPTGAPQETVSHVFNVTNTGTLPDEISVAAVLDTVGQASNVVLQVSESRIRLNPGESAQVRLDQTYSPTIPSNLTVQATLGLRSLLDERTGDDHATANSTVTSKVLPYQFADVNGDGLRDYAVDRDQDSSDGFEEFRATTTPGGRPLAAADLTQFLRDDVREALSQDITLSNGTVVRRVVLVADGDGDGKVDHLLDADGDAQPDYYWDPDANKASPIEFRKDVNGDQVPESFVDTDGDGRLDSVYDLTRASFTDVIQLDVDGDGELDYVVDRNGNGRVDQDETVLYTREGTLLIVQKVDVDGDRRLDQVFDTNADGAPDYFIPAGSTESVPIVLRDVNSDGTQDWTFDGDGDGRRESYYDPVTGKAHVIDAAGHFGDALRKYWYIGALFAVVLALFIALVLVTRR